MYGAIIGDFAGSIYEYEQLKNVKSIYTDEIIDKDAFFSDDTILTIAVLDAILNGCSYDEYLRLYINKYKDYKPNFSPYFKTSFSPSIIKWSNGKERGHSKGNGALMRISPVGFMFDSYDDVVKNATLATIPSHDSDEAIESAKIVALIIFYLRNGLNIHDIYEMLRIDVKYEPFKKFNTTCSETLGNCLYALYNSNSFNDAIKKTLLMGGDTDTNCCIVGSMASALYGVSDELIRLADNKIPHDFVKVLKKSGRY